MNDSLTIRTERTANLDAATRADVIRVCIAAHQKDEFQGLFEFLPPGGLHILGYLRDELVSHAVVTTRWMQYENLPLLRTAYVDAVATLPSCQRKGFGSTVMQHFTTVIPDYEIGGLETSDQRRFYARLGWEEWRGTLAGRGDEGLVPTPDQIGVMILRLPRTPALNLDGLLTIECQSSRIW